MNDNERMEVFEDYAMGCVGVIAAVIIGGVLLLGGIYVVGSFVSWVITSEEKTCTILEKENLWSGDETVMTVDTSCGHMEISSGEPSIYTYLEEGQTYNLTVTGPPIPVITIMEAERV